MLEVKFGQTKFGHERNCRQVVVPNVEKQWRLHDLLSDSTVEQALSAPQFSCRVTIYAYNEQLPALFEPRQRRCRI